MIQNIIDELKNQGIELDAAQLELLNYLNDYIIYFIFYNCNIVF